MFPSKNKGYRMNLSTKCFNKLSLPNVLFSQKTRFAVFKRSVTANVDIYLKNH